MSEKTLQCKAEEVKACCCVDVGTIIDNSDLTVDFSQSYVTEAQAKEALEYLTQKARAAESEPCEIKSEITAVENSYQLNAHFTFSCQAETMIFQLSTR
ncbi:YfcZ/YiiS family protein [[Pasteurella] aerogenes]